MPDIGPEGWRTTEKLDVKERGLVMLRYLNALSLFCGGNNLNKDIAGKTAEYYKSDSTNYRKNSKGKE